MTESDLNFFTLQTMTLGQSNSKLELLKSSDGQFFVRKYGASVRIINQFCKHKVALRNGILPLKAPKIIGEFETKTNSYVMEYIRGNPLGVFISDTSSFEMNIVSDTICSYLSTSYESNSKDSNLNHQFEVKLNFILDKIKEDYEIDKIFSELALFCQINNQKYEYPSGWNHGDLSFENIIVVDNSLHMYGIDFLDSPFESPLIDFGRLWLDSNYGWWGSGYRETSNSFINRCILTNKLAKLANKLEIESKTINLFTAFAILRIRPYTKKAMRLAYLKSAAKKILEGD